MARSQRPGGMTALGVLNILVCLTLVMICAGKIFAWRQEPLTFVEDYGGTTGFLVCIGLDGVLILLLLVNAIGLFRRSQVLGKLGAFLLLLLGVATVVTPATIAPEAVSLGSIAILAYTAMPAVLILTVFRRDFGAYAE